MKRFHFVFVMLLCAMFGAMAQQKVSSYVKPELVQYKKSFKMNGKNYTMYWVYSDKDIKPESLGVSNIYLVPSDFKPINPLGYFNDNNCPPDVQKLILHDIPGKEFLEAYVDEIKCDNNGQNRESHRYGVRLPDDIANEIIDLSAGDTKFSCSKQLSQFGSTTSEELTPLKIEKFR